MDEMNQEAVQAMLEGFNLLLKEAISNTTKIYDGFVIGQNGKIGRASCRERV